MLNRPGWNRLIVAALSAILFTAGSASASVLLSAKGWQVSMPAWTSAISSASIIEDPANASTLVIEITKNFRGQLIESGAGPTITMTFTQTAADASTATRIIINDESVSNNTNFSWDEFHFGLSQMGYASFDHGQTFPGDVGGNPAQNFSISPFANHSWTSVHPDPGNPQTWTDTLNLTGGAVPVGGMFGPGSASGALVINLDLTSLDGSVSNGSFTMSEFPVHAPEPLSFSLLALGGLAMLARRRSPVSSR